MMEFYSLPGRFVARIVSPTSADGFSFAVVSSGDRWAIPTPGDNGRGRRLRPTWTVVGSTRAVDPDDLAQSFSPRPCQVRTEVISCSVVRHETPRSCLAVAPFDVALRTVLSRRAGGRGGRVTRLNLVGRNDVVLLRLRGERGRRGMIDQSRSRIRPNGCRLVGSYGVGLVRITMIGDWWMGEMSRLMNVQLLRLKVSLILERWMGMLVGEVLVRLWLMEHGLGVDRRHRGGVGRRRRRWLV
jgi:hypothetical protein